MDRVNDYSQVTISLASQMTIARAMKHRVRVATRLNRISGDIQSQNSCLSENNPEVDIKKLLLVREALMNHLVDLRVAIDKASEPIKRHLFRLAEFKAKMVFLRDIDTKDGSVRDLYGSSEKYSYKSVYRKSDVDGMVTVLETDIDALQERLDAHNATTSISIEVPEVFAHPNQPTS